MAGKRRLRKVGIAVLTAPLLLAAVIGTEVWLAINAPRLPDAAPYDLDRSGDGKRILWLGDSTAAGVGATTRERALPALVSAARADESGATVVSRAVSGAQVAEVIDEQLPGVAGQRFDRIYISIGANDVTALTSRGDFRHLYERMLQSLPPADDVVLLGVPDMGAPPRLPQPLRAIAGFRGEQLDAVIVELAKKYGHTYVDIAGETGPAFRSASVRNFAADDFHPSDEGYELWRDAVIEAVQRPTER